MYELKSLSSINSQVKKRRNTEDFYYGMKKGIPIALGYIPVSFTFGLMAVNGGMPVWAAILISLSNFTSAGQFAGANLIMANSALFEIGLTTFVVNIRYMLMSLSLSQKIKQDMSLLKRCIMSFGITDETFAIASLEKGELSFSYMMGLISCPYIGWAFGTTLGAIVCSMLPKALQNSMGIALYAMFIALVIPPAKKSKAALFVAVTAVGVSCIFAWFPLFKEISGGWSIIACTIIAAGLGAALFPREEDEV
jgi:4-azaleucine resistance transporter AzlC